MGDTDAEVHDRWTIPEAAPSSRRRARRRRRAARRRARTAPEAWTNRLDEAELRAQADAVDARLAAGEELPLAGVPFAVKDNIDVAGVPTTAACAAFAYVAGESATVVQRLLDAGAIYVGKTNLDQFATGLVGTRSPQYGACRNPIVARVHRRRLELGLGGGGRDRRGAARARHRHRRLGTRPGRAVRHRRA